MKRSKPMNRGKGFKRPERERTLQPLYRLARPCEAVRVSEAAAPVPKREYIRSKALREAYRLIPCQHCGRDDGTVCCAHSNWGIHGKGKSIKADDSLGASLCAACHVPLLDQGSALGRAERQALWWAAHVKTVTLLLADGHWPAGVPVPDTSTFPWSGDAEAA